jgi:DNA (cytosine-5)-methyltransferase 1
VDFYSDNDRHAAAWMRELIKAKHLPKGKVDERGIEELQGCDLSRFRRVHLFAGIGGWGYALKLAGWPRSWPVWTGSCPCQPFSAAGKRKGEQDSRHLWPDMFRLIRECRPATVFGEQVSGDDGYRWLAGVFNDLEAEGYACGAADLPACSVGAPQRRYRLFWGASLASTESQRRSRMVSECKGDKCQRARPGRNCKTCGMARADGGRCVGADMPIRQPRQIQAATVKSRHVKRIPSWAAFDTIECQDGFVRRIEPGLKPLVDGSPARMVRLRGYGNSIVPQVAAAFVRAFLESLIAPGLKREGS